MKGLFDYLLQQNYLLFLGLFFLSDFGPTLDIAHLNPM